MKKLFFIILVLAVVYSCLSIYFVDKHVFFCPIRYTCYPQIRSDSWGSGVFAARRSGNRMHNGVDLQAEIGTPVLAARSGRVIAATSNKGMGKYIILKHSGGITTIYGHLSEIYVQKGDFVRQEQTIGAVGKTGNANQRNMLAHLHFEVRKDGVPVDPMQYLE
jgi:murein DD-endopeptidase MepM/ murein hydrolase activator NlpD